MATGARPLRLATRGSALALAQARMVAGALEAAEAGLAVELIAVRTVGDERRGAPPAPADLAAAGEPGDKARFVKEIEEALLAGEADLAVHSAKDVPGELPAGLAIVGVPERIDARDALCGPASTLDALPSGARVGTSSLRRRAQLLARRPDIEVDELRGNVDTRLRRLADGDYDAVVLARAGLLRLDREDGVPIPMAEMTPAPGQGCLALEARAEDERTTALAGRLTHRCSLVRLTAERAVVAALDATCRTPMGACAELEGGGGEADGGGGAGRLRLAAFVGLPDGSEWIRDELAGDAEEPVALGHAVAERLLAAGAAELLAAAEQAPEAAGRPGTSRGG